MASIYDEITAMAPTCTPKYLRSRSEAQLIRIRDDYFAREENINYYIKVLKKLYSAYNSYPFMVKSSETSIPINTNDKVLQRYIKCVNKYFNEYMPNSLLDAIKTYIKRRKKAYFENEQVSFPNIMEEYIYYLSLDITLHRMFLKNKRLLNYQNEEKTLGHRRLLENYVYWKFKDSKEYDYIYITPEELAAMGYDEPPEGYALEYFLGPKGPNK